MNNRSVLLRSLSTINKSDVKSLTDQIANLRISDIPASSSSSISDSVDSFVSPNSHVYSYSKNVLDRFYKNTKDSDLRRSVIDKTKSSLNEIPSTICDLTSKSIGLFLNLSFRILPNQDSFITQKLRLPKTKDGLIAFKNKLGLSKPSNVGLSQISYDSFMEKATNIYSGILVDAITYNNSHYGRFLVLVQLGLRCTVWYGFHPGAELGIPVDCILFNPMESYENFINYPDTHVQHGFNKITLVENEDNILPKLAEGYTSEKPFSDVKIPNASGSVFMSVGLGLAIVILLSLGVSPDLNVITA
ncbi:hypothetical protein Salmi_Mp074 (mitochondrion) [Salvia miltiorrhiza]|uniref:Uncharacterized protein n=1 Tax=Salvia miltiorrhiza TaxID=226208 RepID=V9P5B6_SALMI|nr:hypothetical protein Salmi_Mp074 [Salvia miltiorrhiza]AGU16603.1 hypothetical protein Salmi_Mp074 [Salvia miltiorrhiza]